MANNNHLLLRFAPSEGCKITMPVVNLGECLTSNSVSFYSYEKRLGLKSSRTELLGSTQSLKGVGKKGIKRCKTDKWAMSRVDEMCIPDNSSDVDTGESGVNGSDKNLTASTEKPNVEVATEPNRFPGRETIDRIRQGWNSEEVNTITVGDLFLMVFICKTEIQRKQFVHFQRVFIFSVWQRFEGIS